MDTEGSVDPLNNIGVNFDRKKADVLINNNKPRFIKKNLCREYSESD